MAREASAWCPGGRTATKAASSSPRATRRAASTVVPAARRAISALSRET
jgi:hypothetical protein